MEPVTTGALIAGAASLLGAGASAIGAGKANNKAVRLAREMRQKDIQQWHATNFYNSPAQQMQRLREAGLNPNLIYGSSSGTTVASQPPSAKVPEVQNELASMSHINLTPAISMYQDMKVKQAQEDNIRQQIEVSKQKMFTESLVQNSKVLQNLRSEFNLGLVKKLEQYTLEGAALNNQYINRKIATENFNQLMQEKMLPFNQRNIDSMIKGREFQNKNIESMIGSRGIQNAINQMTYDYESKQRELGIDPKAPWYIRQIGTGYSRTKDNLYNFINGLRTPYRGGGTSW